MTLKTMFDHLREAAEASPTLELQVLRIGESLSASTPAAWVLGCHPRDDGRWNFAVHVGHGWHRLTGTDAPREAVAAGLHALRTGTVPAGWDASP